MSSSFQLHLTDYPQNSFVIPTQLQIHRHHYTLLQRDVPRQLLTPYFNMGNFVSGIALPGRVEQQSRNENAIPTLIDSLNAARLKYKKGDVGQSRSADTNIADHIERSRLLEAAKELVAALEIPEIAVLEVSKWV